MHNVTMRIVANRFDDEALHIAFGETLLASWCQERRNASWIGPLKKYLVDGWWSVPVTWAACHMPAKEGRKEGRKDGRTTNWSFMGGARRERLFVCLVICMRRKKGRT
jgi:hypothetical protein